MKNKPGPFVRFGIGAALLLVVHALLHRWLASRNIVAVLLAPVPQASFWTLTAAILFVLVRFVTLFFLPGLFLCQLGCYMFDRLRKRRQRIPEQQ